MRALVLLIAVLAAGPVSAQEISSPSTFCRLLVFNEAEELLVVKIEGRDLWVTPGWYQDNQSTLREGIEDLAGSHGLAITQPVLRGVFTLKMGEAQNVSTRLIYSATVWGGDATAPEGIDEVRWLAIPDALEVLSLPHITYQIEQIVQHPRTVWGGSQSMRREGGVNVFTVLEPFYPLFSATE